MSAGEPVIEFNAVSHSYGEIGSVRDVSFSVGAGQTLALVGPSGCGKSTLLKLAAGLLWPQAGEVRIRGRALRADTARQLRERTGYVIQSGGLFPHLTARDNVTLAARCQRRERSWIDSRIAELSELVQLAPALLQRFPGQLSGGQRQRISLMRALMLDPDVLLLDEPLGALDPIVRHELQDQLRHLFERLGKAVLLVTHDLAEAAFFTEILCLMRAGRVVQQGSYAELATVPAEQFVSEFVMAQRGLPDLHRAANAR